MQNRGWPERGWLCPSAPAVSSRFTLGTHRPREGLPFAPETLSCVRTSRGRGPARWKLPFSAGDPGKPRRRAGGSEWTQGPGTRLAGSCRRCAFPGLARVGRVPAACAPWRPGVCRARPGRVLPGVSPSGGPQAADSSSPPATRPRLHQDCSPPLDPRRGTEAPGLALPVANLPGPFPLLFCGASYVYLWPTRK